MLRGDQGQQGRKWDPFQVLRNAGHVKMLSFRDLVKPCQVVRCRGGSRYVEGCWGFRYWKSLKVLVQILKFLKFQSFKVSKSPNFKNFKVSKFSLNLQHFKVSKFQRFKVWKLRSFEIAKLQSSVISYFQKYVLSFENVCGAPLKTTLSPFQFWNFQT